MSCKHNSQYSDNHSHLCFRINNCLSTSTLLHLPLPQHPHSEHPTMLPSLVLTCSQPHTYTTHSPQPSCINHHSTHGKSHAVSHNTHSLTTITTLLHQQPPFHLHPLTFTTTTACMQWEPQLKCCLHSYSLTHNTHAYTFTSTLSYQPPQHTW